MLLKNCQKSLFAKSSAHKWCPPVDFCNISMKNYDLLLFCYWKTTLPDTLPWKWRNDSKSFCQRDLIVLKPLQKLILNLRSFSSQFLGLKFFKVGWTFLCVFFAETSFCETETSKLWLSWTFVSVFSWLKNVFTRRKLLTWMQKFHAIRNIILNFNFDFSPMTS